MNWTLYRGTLINATRNDYAMIIYTDAGICITRIREISSDDCLERECAYVALSAMKLQMQLMRDDAAKRRRPVMKIGVD